MRRTIGIIAGVALIAGLTACSSGSAADQCTSLASEGSAVQSVKVTGEFGEKPTADFTAPLSAESTERMILSKGDGNLAVPNGTIQADFTFYNGTTGEQLGQTAYDGSTLNPLPLNDDNMIHGMVAAFQCAPVGSQIVAVMAPNDLLDPSGNPIAGLDGKTSIVIVADLVSASISRANGKDQTAPDGLPKVVLDPNGVPGITIPSTDAPKDLKVAVLKKGDGAVVTADSTVTVHYTGVTWIDGKVFDSSWAKNTPLTLQLSNFVPGFQQALEGQTVGSQILAVIPPDLAYGENGQGTIPGGATLVFVVDILATTP
ncbi:FKBP-type peptidyl-prolyl cis-trans isomerase [Aurantimicrobium minutum]|uniref:FKBP-type peptidyl-prolyl cis-trans isomerase n=1 Tax=Aurantimicrobium minutum TaxID=708131 RepID=UPI0024739B28|nr:FKBP-type peptidyl-prolyl cis-trans isomerase [Aurantimicrobium minutum]